MGVALVPVGIAYLIGSPITAAIIGKEFVWWRGITFAAVRVFISMKYEQRRNSCDFFNSLGHDDRSVLLSHSHEVKSEAPHQRIAVKWRLNFNSELSPGRCGDVGKDQFSLLHVLDLGPGVRSMH